MAASPFAFADSLGFDTVWEVEHHFLEAYSHASAPEVFLAASSLTVPLADPAAAKEG